MDPRSLKSAIDRLSDAAAEPGLWSEVLPLVADAVGAVGAACFVYNDQTDGVEWAYIHGPAAERRYVEQYAVLDPYRPALPTAGRREWSSISECVPAAVLSGSEWYHDFIKAGGFAEALGANVHRAGSRRIYVGLHFKTPEKVPPRDARLRLLLRQVETSAGIWHRQRVLRLDASLGAWTIDRHPDALFVVYDGGRVVLMNAAAERLLSRGDALAVENGRLVATTTADAGPFAALMTAAAGAATADAPARPLLLGAAQGNRNQLVRAFPFPDAGPNTGRAVVRVTDLFAGLPVTMNLQRIFGLSPAENRLAEALLQGKTLQEMAQAFGVALPTLRVQVRSVFRKCGVKRQVDLVRVLLRAA